MAFRINMGGGANKSNNKPKQTLNEQAINNNTVRGNPTSVAIGSGTTLGTDAGAVSQGSFTVAIGYEAGQTSQRQDAVAIGFKAGKSLKDSL